MFYNALMRKGKGGDVQESDVADVVSVHNAMNERTWRQVLDFERLHEAECGTPRLTRFEGRPFDLSPLARLYTLMGYTAPFDRHDWYVDRCGKQVRYVIDFYYDEAQGVVGEGADAGATGETPTGAAMRMSQSMHARARLTRGGVGPPARGWPARRASQVSQRASSSRARRRSGGGTGPRARAA